MSIDRFATRLTMRHLRTVIAVAETKSLLAASRQLNLTQPTVSKALKEAEATAGVELFARTNRGVVATPYGEALVHHAKLVMAQMAHAYGELSDLKDGTGGHVVVGTLITASSRLLPDAIVRLHRERPRLSITIVEGTNDILMPALRTGEIDLVVGRLPEYRERAGLAHETLFQDNACVVVRPGHRLARKRRAALADLKSERWLLPRAETTLRRQIEKDFNDAGLHPPTAVVESVSSLANRQLLLTGDYVSVWPGQIARADQMLGVVAILPVDLPSTAGPVGISTRREGRLSPAAGALIEALRSVGRGIEKPRRRSN